MMYPISVVLVVLLTHLLLELKNSSYWVIKPYGLLSNGDESDTKFCRILSDSQYIEPMSPEETVVVPEEGIIVINTELT